jgi:hypothetical protein
MPSLTKRETFVIFYNNFLASLKLLWSYISYEHIWRNKVAGLLKLITLYTLQWTGITRLWSCNNVLHYSVRIAALGAHTEWWQIVIACNGVTRRVWARFSVQFICFTLKNLFFPGKTATFFWRKLLKGNTAYRELNVRLYYNVMCKGLARQPNAHWSIAG